MRIFAIEDNLTGKDIRLLRKKLGITQIEMAALFDVSPKTLERWEYENKKLTGPIVALAKLLWEKPQIVEHLEIPPKTCPLRLWYMCKNRICTVIDVDERNRMVRIYNYTNDLLSRAFGVIEHPSFEDYEEFLESRCFPRTRDKMKLILKEMDLPFYDPFMIIEKTNGRMAEDDYWIRIER